MKDLLNRIKFFSWGRFLWKRINRGKEVELGGRGGGRNMIHFTKIYPAVPIQGIYLNIKASSTMFSQASYSSEHSQAVDSGSSRGIQAVFR